ncbi:N-acetylmuramidase domain-containing protein [Novosphingobium sp. RD2P27]|uniref:N-acetylmuramidase domain-containing protein n=1 Tax=Novosphingobium kalidii TaxID=3230299 RepID=A0ABV2CZ80_9SPHN
MRDEFTGNSAPLQDIDYENAARKLGCSVAAVRAVAHVESAGDGFLPDGRPKILFERHVFHKRTAGRHSTRHPQLSSIQRGGYLGGTREYERLRKALALDRKSALESTSWGRFQIMGFNCASCGHDDVESFVKAMVTAEPNQLAAFVAFLKTCGLEDELIRCDWSGFARRYNGPAFAENAYDRKLAEAYARFSAISLSDDTVQPLLRVGDRGAHVKRLQTLLGLVVDGSFGPVTERAVLAVQKLRGLKQDGIVGAATWKALSQ